MRIRVLLILFSWLGGSICAIGQNPVYDLDAKPKAVRVRILATSTSIRLNFAGNQEVYLANVSSKGDALQLAKLVDSYTPSELPIRRALLVDDHSFRMKLTRDPECDTTGSAFFIGGQSTVFDKAAPSLLKDRAAGTIPCYKVDHHATRLAK